MPNRAKDWLAQAFRDLEQAEASRRDGRHEWACFAAQQAAEKAVKAVLVSRRIRFPYVHDLEVLLNSLAENGIAVPDGIWVARKLTPYAVEARYPSVAREVTDEQYKEALEVAEDVVR